MRSQLVSTGRGTYLVEEAEYEPSWPNNSALALHSACHYNILTSTYKGERQGGSGARPEADEEIARALAMQSVTQSAKVNATTAATQLRNAHMQQLKAVEDWAALHGEDPQIARVDALDKHGKKAIASASGMMILPARDTTKVELIGLATAAYPPDLKGPSEEDAAEAAETAAAAAAPAAEAATAEAAPAAELAAAATAAEAAGPSSAPEKGDEAPAAATRKRAKPDAGAAGQTAPKRRLLSGKWIAS